MYDEREADARRGLRSRQLQRHEGRRLGNAAHASEQPAAAVGALFGVDDPAANKVALKPLAIATAAIDMPGCRHAVVTCDLNLCLSDGVNEINCNPGAPGEPLKAQADALNWDIDKAVNLLTR